jgi:hypothetical protein
MTGIEAFPLTWPSGRRRINFPSKSRFAEITFGRARDALFHELEMLGAQNKILSTNIPLRLDGIPYSGRTPPADKGVAVYFQFKKKPMVFACDEWDKIEHNVWAIAKTIEALRGIQRWGSGDMLERAFTGFASLPNPETKKHWREVLGFMNGAVANKNLVKEKRDSLALSHHPDRGGNSARMSEINAAFEQAMEEL